MRHVWRRAHHRNSLAITAIVIGVCLKKYVRGIS